MAAEETREDLLARFQECYLKKDYRPALEASRDLVARNPRDARGWSLMGAIYLALGQEADAREVVRRALEIDPKDALAYHTLGDLAAHGGDHEAAILQYQRTIDLAPDKVDGYLGMADAHFQIGDYANAVYYYSQATQRSPGNPDVARNFGLTLMRMGQLTKAVYYLKMAIEYRPDWPEPHLELGEALRRQGEDRDALAELLAGLRMKQRPDGLVSLGRIHLKYGEPRKALVHLHRAVQLDPQYGPAHHALGLCEGALGNWAGAINHFDYAYRLAPDTVEYCLDLAGALVAEGRDFERAHRLASAVRMKDPNVIRTYDVMGRANFKQGRVQEAFEDLEKARTLLEVTEVRDACAADVYEHLAEVYAAMNDSMMSREMYSRALEVDPARRKAWQQRQQAAANPDGGGQA